jgi:hypothetical protein
MIPMAYRSDRSQQFLLGLNSEKQRFVAGNSGFGMTIPDFSKTFLGRQPGLQVRRADSLMV